jgi:hypothetical protein
VEFLMSRILDKRAKVDDSKRKYGNRPTVADDSWTTPELWSRMADLNRKVTKGEQVALFFDGSKSRDATALIACTIDAGEDSTGGHVFTLGVWEPPGKHSGKDDPGHNDRWTVPVQEVDDKVAWAFDQFDVVAFFSDVQEWESFAKVDWPKKYGTRLRIKAVPGGKSPEPIAWDMRNNLWDFTKACELVEAEIRDARFTHDGNPALARHIANARRKPNRYGVSIGKETPSSPRKIDAAVCTVGVRHARRLVIAKNPKRRTGRAMGV